MKSSAFAIEASTYSAPSTSRRIGKPLSNSILSSDIGRFPFPSRVYRYDAIQLSVNPIVQFTYFRDPEVQYGAYCQTNKRARRHGDPHG